MKRRTKFIITLAAILILILSPLIIYRIYAAICWQIYLLDPNVVQHKYEAYQKLSSEELIGKLGLWNIWWFDTSLDILAERKENKAVPYIIKLLESSYKYKRDSAMRALAKIGDKRAIEPLMKIVKKGEESPDYHEALYALAKLKYEGAFPYVVDLANKNDKYAINMLKAFEKSEGIPLLEVMQKTIKGDDTISRIYRDDINEAINHIERTIEQ